MFRRVLIKRNVPNPHTAATQQIYQKPFKPSIQHHQPTSVPSFDIYEIADKAEDGRMIRVMYVNHGIVTVAHYPQQGPRKTDPRDPEPQFDMSRRQSIQLQLCDIGEMLAVADGKIPMAVIPFRHATVTYQKDTTKERTYNLAVVKPATETTPEMKLVIPFQKHFVIMWHNFMDSVVRNSFGFR
eukprot:PhF_6_TR29484/c0_g1_i1/m.43675